MLVKWSPAVAVVEVPVFKTLKP